MNIRTECVRFLLVWLQRLIIIKKCIIVVTDRKSVV